MRARCSKRWPRQLPWPAVWEEQGKAVGVSLSLFESLILPLSCFRAVVLQYAAQARSNPAILADIAQPATVEELIAMMNKRPNVTASFAEGDALAYLERVGAEGSHLLMEDGTSSILFRLDVATRRGQKKICLALPDQDGRWNEVLVDMLCDRHAPILNGESTGL